MGCPVHRLVLVMLLLGSGGTVAQPVPPAPPHHHPAHKAHPAGTPVIKPKTGVRAQKVVPPPAAPVVVPPGPPAGPAPEPAPAPPDKDAAPSKGSSTNSPLPRFATLRSDDVNLRSGPGTRYPIDWVYKRRDLPVVIEREFDMWRLVRDPDGIKGWVNQATLAPRRSGVVTASAQAGGAQAGGAQAGGAQAGGAQTMRSDPSDTAAAVAILKPGVIVRLRSCEATSDWCQVSVQDYRGWLRRTQFWGTLPGEAVQ